MSFTNFSLTPKQEEHFRRALKIYKTEPSFFDFSDRGLGKSIILIALALKFGMNIFVVCENSARYVLSKRIVHMFGEENIRILFPANSEDFEDDESEEDDSLKNESSSEETYKETSYEVSEEELSKKPVKIVLLSYQCLRGVKTSRGDFSVRHPFLTRNAKGYETTNEFKKLVLSGGLFLCFDEVHNCKATDSQSFQASHTLVHSLLSLRQKYESARNSKIYLSSATPVSQPKEIFYLFSLLGISSEKTPYDDSRRKEKTKGYFQILEWIEERRDKISWDSFPSYLLEKNRNLTEDSVYTNLDLLYPHLRHLFASQNEDKLPFNIHFFNFVVPIQKKDLLPASSNKIVQSKYTKGSMDTELLEAKIAVPMILSILEEAKERKQNLKFIIFYGYDQTADFCLKNLEGYNCSVVNGKGRNTDVLTRTSIYETFNRPTNDIQILITNYRVSSTSIDLDDTDGNWPRISVCFLSDHFITQSQSSWRICRMRTKSQPRIVRMVLKTEIEMRMLRSEKKKHVRLDAIAPGRHEQNLEDLQTITFSSPNINSFDSIHREKISLFWGETNEIPKEELPGESKNSFSEKSKKEVSKTSNTKTRFRSLK